MDRVDREVKTNYIMEINQNDFKVMIDNGRNSRATQ